MFTCDVFKKGGQVILRHTKGPPYRCFLPDLAGFEGFCCTGPGPLSRLKPIMASDNLNSEKLSPAAFNNHQAFGSSKPTGTRVGLGRPGVGGCNGGGEGGHLKSRLGP